MTFYETNKFWLLHALETYRNMPQDTPERIFIDRLIKASRRNAEKSETEKQYHNLIVLQYITNKRPSVQKICNALHIGRQRSNYETVTANAIDRLLVLAFGIDGIDWE